MSDQLTYDELLARLSEAEELVSALMSAQTDAVVSSQGVHVLRLHATDEALQAARRGLQQMLEQRTRELSVANESLRGQIALRKRLEQVLQRMYESGMVGVIQWTVDGRIKDANTKFLDMIGYTRQELEAGQICWSSLTPAEYRQLDQRAIEHLARTGVHPAYEKEYIRKDGSRVAVLVSSATLGHPPEEGVSIIVDISERKRAEHALIRSEKLASVGRMAATVAHEINNPLELILNAVYIASLDENLSARARESLDAAEQELGRVAQLVRQTLGFYRENSAPISLDPALLVREVVDLYRPKVRQRGISIETEHNGLVHVQAVAGELRQVISNILSNAIDATPSGGRIRARSSSMTLKGELWVRLSFGDTGEGIAQENLEHIFEPFFTTKEAVGTGLGLWITHKIVARHRGKLRVRSCRGRGTVFSVLLPAASNPV